MVHQLFGFELIFGFTVFEIMGIIIASIAAGFLTTFGFKIYRLKKKAERIEDKLSAPTRAESEPETNFADMIDEMAEITEEMGLDIEEVNNLKESQNLEDNLNERWDDE